MSEPFERHSGQLAADVIGTGEAANGLIRTVVGADGRVSVLSLAPELRRPGLRARPRPRGHRHRPDETPPGALELRHRFPVLLSVSLSTAREVGHPCG